jgi:hypothetical protein
LKKSYEKNLRLTWTVIETYVIKGYNLEHANILLVGAIQGRESINEI